MKSIIFGLLLCLVAARVPINQRYASQIQEKKGKTWNIEDNITEHAKNNQMQQEIYQDNTTICVIANDFCTDVDASGPTTATNPTTTASTTPSTSTSTTPSTTSTPPTPKLKLGATNTGTCHVAVTAFYANVTSPNYPRDHPPNTHCVIALYSPEPRFLRVMPETPVIGWFDSMKISGVYNQNEEITENDNYEDIYFQVPV
ncbi:ponticulin-like protein H [Hyalella azteca]|uniref:Ponticulin-like protein H n=1 Tax=Hyalella azteca TaxID=294128 RepID=A0A979FTW0_HYAAZ|nr:ponticulin-like protein H [Hyalella azteca]